MKPSSAPADSANPPALTRIYAWFAALAADDMSLMQDLLTHGLPVDALHPLRHTTALMEATRLGRASAVAWLLQQGAAPVSLCGLPRGTPLHLAIKRHHWEIAEMLVAHTPTCRVLDGYSRTPLHTLAMDMPEDPADTARALRLASRLVEKHCPADTLDHEGITALHYSVINDYAPLTKLLLELGANANIRTPDAQVSPLIIAALEKNIQLAQLLLQHGADPHLQTQDGATAYSIMPGLAQLQP